AVPVDDVGEGEAERVRLVQRDLERARDDLHRAGEAARRRENERDALGRDTAVARDLVREGRGRTPIDLEHQARGVGPVAVAELGEERFLQRERTPGSGGERMERLLA